MGRWDVDQMLSEMSGDQFLEWQAFHSRHAIGAAGDDLRAGVIAATIANFSPNSRKHNHTASDFVLKFRPKSNAVADAIRAALGVPLPEDGKPKSGKIDRPEVKAPARKR